ncbi:MAG: hypothetical protein WKF77_14060 [Planctomycetaceae bacterium]
MVLFKAVPPFFAVACGLSSTSAANAVASVATGVVFLDTNGSHTRDADETGLAGVGVSNGREVVQTGIHIITNM